MKTYVALLRGVNLPKHKQVAMADLCDLGTQLGFADARSVLLSGNLVFRCDTRKGPQLEGLLEREARQRLDLETDVMVRTAEEWKAVVARNPFRTEAQHDPAHLVVMFFKKAPDARNLGALRAAITGPELIRANGREAYIVYPNGIGRSRLTNALIEKTLGTRGTGRNWNTVLKLNGLC